MDRCGKEKTDFMPEILRRVRGNMGPLELGGTKRKDRDETEYFRYYGIDFPSAEHVFGSFESGSHTLAGHVFQPNQPKGTVFLLHGYFDHTGILKNLIEKCLDRQYTTAVFDLPGHGLSTGERASIDDFGEYEKALEDFAGACRAMAGPYFGIGHSTGGAVIFEHLRNGNGIRFEKIALLAPLVRPAAWRLSKFAYRLGNRFIPKIPRGEPKSSSDPDFIEFLKKDPLQTWHIPMTWLNAMFEWERRIRPCGKIRTEILVIQGTDDDVLDWRYNLRFLKNKLPNCAIKKIEDGKHHLANDKGAIRSEVMKLVGDFL